MMKVALTIQSPLLIIVQFKNDYEIILYFYHLKKRDFYNFVMNKIASKLDNANKKKFFFEYII